MHSLAVYCADIGSVMKDRFGWCGATTPSTKVQGTEINKLAEAVANELKKGRPVALGFECPLFVPFAVEPTQLASARPGDGNRAWSASAGATVLVTGLVQVLWILHELRRLVGDNENTFLDWKAFEARGSGLFLWEAFVSGPRASRTHADDAKASVESFLDALPNPLIKNAVRCTSEVYSLIGAALLRSGWASDLSLLSQPCLVIKSS
ncbi:MAG: hypothetical protein HY313_04495 [Acidobacteria bacterium]|nr:hypothetical protein [Acidobacteriota bacterium]